MTGCVYSVIVCIIICIQAKCEVSDSFLWELLLPVAGPGGVGLVGGEMSLRLSHRSQKSFPHDTTTLETDCREGQVPTGATGDLAG
jgi:hypothetical protein